MKKIIFSLMAAALLASCGGGNANSGAEKCTEESTPKCAYNFLDAKEKSFDGFTVCWLKDNANDRNFPFDLFGDVADSVKQSLNMPDGMPSSMSAYLVKSNGKNILFDSGLGQKAGGQLLDQLAKFGVTPDKVDYVYITHFHGDHIGGMVSPEGEKVFTNAEVYVSQLEKASELGKSDLAVAMIEKYGDKIHEFNFGDTLPEDVLAMDAVGHTPGHTVFRKGDLLIIGDLMHALALQLPYPEYCANFDGDKEKSIASRRRILEYAKQNNLTICGMHLPY